MPNWIKRSLVHRQTDITKVTRVKRVDTLFRRYRGRAGVVLGLLLFGLLGACDDSSSVDTEGFIQRATEHHQKGDLRASIIELKNVLQKDPNNAAARLLLGRVYLDFGDNAGGDKELRRARDLGADPADLMEPLGRAWMRVRKYDQILEEFQVDETAPPERRALVLTLRGGAHAGLGRLAEAEENVRNALALDPGNVLAIVGRARLAQAQGDNAMAEAALKDALRTAAKDPDVLILKGDFEFDRGEFDTALDAYQELVDIRRFNPFHRLRLANAQIMVGKIDEALANIDRAMKNVPKHPQAIFLKALAAYQAKNYNLADTYAKEVLAIASEHLPSQLVAGAANYALGQFQQAARYLAVFLNDVPSHDMGRRLYGATLLNLRRGKDAVLALQPLLDKADDDALLLTMVGIGAIQNRDFEAGKVYFEKASGLQPENPEIRARLGTIQVGLGNLEQGIEELEKAIALDPKSGRVAFDLFTTHMRARQFDQALDVAMQIQKNRPDIPLGYTLAGMVHATLGDFGDARAAFEKALEVKAGDPDASINIALLELRNGNADRARTILGDALKHNPKNVLLLLRLGALEARLQNWDEARLWAEKAVAADPKALRPSVFLARLHLRAGNPVKALGVAQRTLREHPDNPDLLKIVGQAQLDSGDAAAAAITLRSLVKAQPKSLEARYLLAEAYRAQQDWPRRREQLEKAATLQPKSAQLRAQLGATQLELGNLRQGIEELERAMTLDPELDQAAFDLFSAHMRTRQYDQALEVAKHVQAKRPDSALGFTLAGMAHAAKGELAEARAAFGKSLEIKPGAPDASINLAIMEAEAGEPDKARKVLEEALEHDPKSAVLMTRLASLEASQGQWDLAKSLIERAVEADPNAVAAKIILARMHLRTGDWEKALAVARGDLQIHPKNPGLLSVVGQAQLTAGRFDAAAATFRSLVDVIPKSLEARYLLAAAYQGANTWTRYRETLERILSMDPGQMRAKIDLASLLEQQGDLETAVQLLDQLKTAMPDNGAVIELDGKIALRQNRISDAIALFKKAAEIQPSSRLTRRLAGIQWRAGDREDGLATLKNWLEQYPKDNAARMTLGNLYLEINRLDEARANFAVVVEAQPDSWVARNELAWVLLRVGDAKAALPHAERALELAKDNPAVLDTAGLILLDLGKHGRAVELLRRAARGLKNNPEIQYHLAQALAKGGDKAGARDVLRQILSDKADFPERNEAESLLKELGS
jgi:putative PEP-CTERM system TPR-repeat lipoprotein